MSDSKIMVGSEVNTDIAESRTKVMAGLHCGGTSVAAVLPWLLQPWGGQGSPSGHWDQFHTWDLQRKHARREQQSQHMTGKM